MIADGARIRATTLVPLRYPRRYWLGNHDRGKDAAYTSATVIAHDEAYLVAARREVDLIVIDDALSSDFLQGLLEVSGDLLREMVDHVARGAPRDDGDIQVELGLVETDAIAGKLKREQHSLLVAL